jgi:nucleoside-diphosphate-sugar epimerase
MNTTNKTILIGPTGFLGPAFLEKDPSIIAVGRDYLKLPKHLNNEFFYIESDASFAQLNDLDFQNVIFLIGCSDHHRLNIHPTLAIEKNVLALSRFLWYLKQSKRKVNKIINFTTMLQYDTSKMILPCDESQPRNPMVNNYVMSKYMSELITQQHRDEFDIIDVRISNVYGPTRLLRPDIVPSTIWSLIHNKSASVWTKKPKRDFIYVEDAIDAVLKLIESDFSGSVNLGTGIGSTVGELCECLEELSNIKITDQNIKVPGHMEFYQDISLLKSIIDWEPKYSLKEGLTKTYQKMKEYYKEKEVRNRLGNLNKN